MSHLNDANEWVGGLDFFLRHAETRNNDRLNQLAEGLELFVKGGQPLPWFVACFSKRPNICSQWERYADNHRGVCLEFNSTGLVSDLMWMLEVRYGVECWIPAVNELLDNIENLPADDDFTVAIGRVCHLAVQCKTQGWSLEEEIRLFGIVPDPILFEGNSELRQRVESWQRTDNRGRNYALLPFESHAITSITVGKSGDKHAVKDILNEFDFSHVAIREA